jgi:hypothetical protein
MMIFNATIYFFQPLLVVQLQVDCAWSLQTDSGKGKAESKRLEDASDINKAKRGNG